MSATKNDSGKLPLDLLPFDVLESAAVVLQHGATKYSARNWEKGFAWSRLFAAVLRHLFAWGRGQRIDPEWGLSHLDHALVSLMFLRAHELRKLGDDDLREVISAEKTAPMWEPGNKAIAWGQPVTLVRRNADLRWEIKTESGNLFIYEDALEEEAPPPTTKG